MKRKSTLAERQAELRLRARKYDARCERYRRSLRELSREPIPQLGATKADKEAMTVEERSRMEREVELVKARPEYWEEVLRRYGLSMTKGLLPDDFVWDF